LGDKLGGCTIYELGCSKKNFVPIFQGHRSMSKESETHLNNVSMFMLSNPILLLGVQARDMMRDLDCPKKGIKFLIFPTLIGLNGNDLAIKHTFNKLLNFMEIFGDLIFLA
jgi:hypothetical protein